jgi:undecaprenyl phosphate-alpha-L-ara4N flippase subunit ArnE
MGKKINIGITLMFLSSLCVCFGQLFWKISTVKMGTGNIIFLMTGFVLYGCGALVMIGAYHFGSVSILQPMLSLNYVFTPFIAHFILGEVITIRKLIGIGVIIISVILLGIPERKS